METRSDRKRKRSSNLLAALKKCIAEDDVKGFKRLVLYDDDVAVHEVCSFIHAVDEVSEKRDTPLSGLCRVNKFPMVSAIIEFLETNQLLATMDSPKGGAGGATSLYISCQEGHVEVAKVLIEAGANVDKATSDNGKTPLYVSCSANHVEVVKVLIAAGANVDKATSDDGKTPLYVSCSANHVEVVKVLIAAGADVDKATSDDGTTPLSVSCSANHVEVVKVLIAEGADVDKATSDYGITPLLECISNGLVEVVKVLIEAGADVDKAAIGDDLNGVTPLHLSCLNGHFEITKMLLANGASVNTRSAIGITPIDFTCIKGHEQCISLLLAYNADYKKAKAGRFAHELGHMGCVRILREWPAKRNQIALKMCASELKRQGMYAVVNSVGVNELSKPLFVFKVLEEMMSRQMYGLAETIVAYVGSDKIEEDDYSDKDDYSDDDDDDDSSVDYL